MQQTCCRAARVNASILDYQQEKVLRCKSEAKVKNEVLRNGLRTLPHPLARLRLGKDPSIYLREPLTTKGITNPSDRSFVIWMFSWISSSVSKVADGVSVSFDMST